MEEDKKHSGHWPYQLELLSTSVKWLITIAILSTVIISLWLLSKPQQDSSFWRTLIQNIFILLAAFSGWQSLRLVRRGQLHWGSRLFLGIGLGLSGLIMLTSEEQFVMDGIVFLSMILLIGFFILPLREALFWGVGAILLTWLFMLLRYSIPLYSIDVNWPDLVALYAFRGLVLGAFILLGRNIAGKLDAALTESQDAQYTLTAQAMELKQTIAAQQLSENKCQSIFAASPDLVYLTDLEGSLLDANPALLETVGLSLPQMQTMNVIDFFAPSDPSKLTQATMRLHQGEPIYGIEVQAKIQEDELRDYEINAVTLPGEEGEPAKVLNLARDVTNRNRAEAELKNRLEYEHLLAEISSLAVDAKDIDSFLDRCIQMMAELLDVSRIYIFEHDYDTDTLNNTFEWVAPGVSAQREILQGIPVSEVSWWMETTADGSVINYSDINEVPGKSDREGLRVQDIKSILIVPLFVAEKHYGLIGFDECREHRHWSEEDVQALLSVSRIITGTIERRQAEKALRASEEKYRLLSETTSDVILLHDMNGRICYVNRAGIDILGFAHSELVGQSLSNFIPQELMADALSRGEQRIAGNKEVNHYELEFLNQARERIPFDVNSTPILTNGQVNQILVVARDITERKEAERKLKRSEASYRGLFDNATDAIYIQDGEGRFLDVNEGVTNMYGYPKEFFIGKTPEPLAAPGRNDLHRIAECIHRAFEGEPQQFEFWGLRSNGEEFPKIVRLQKGQYFGQEVLIAFALDITERVQMEQQMVRHERMASVGQMAAGIAHDFNNILTGILGFTQLLQRSPNTPNSMQSSLQRISDSSEKAAFLVRQILDFSQKTVRKPQQIDLCTFVPETVDFLKSTIPENIQITLNLEPDTYLIEADQTQLQQVITNLALNARDAMSTGGELRIELSRVDCVGDVYCALYGQPIIGEWIQLQMTDSGSGIAPDILPRIFEPFFTTREIGEGSGLGLSQVAGIVGQHQGYITVDSREGLGTTFALYLSPLRDATQTSGVKSTQMGQEQGETILIAEDEPLVLEAMTAMLKFLGYEVLTASNGQEATAQFDAHSQKIALVLSDMVMPDGDGEMLFHRLKAKNPDLKMIIMSGYPLGDKGAQLLEQGITDWLKKPITIDQLSQVVQKALSDKKGGGIRL